MTNRLEKSQGVPNIVAQFSTCCIADFQIGAMREIERPAGLETRDTADLFAAANPSGGGKSALTARRPDFGSIGFRRSIGLRNCIALRTPAPKSLPWVIHPIRMTRSCSMRWRKIKSISVVIGSTIGWKIFRR
jgi:hypothetical protein